MFTVMWFSQNLYFLHFQERKRKNAAATAVPPAIANGYNMISPPALYENVTNGFAGGAHGGPARMMGEWIELPFSGIFSLG